MIAYGYGLNKDLADKVRTQIFAEGDDRNNPHYSPMQPPTLAHLPPAIIATANFDIIRDQGRVLADCMRTDGIQVVYKNYGSLTHGFLQHTKTIDDALQAATETAQLYGQLIRGKYRGTFH